jgi:hypothetical protein
MSDAMLLGIGILSGLAGTIAVSWVSLKRDQAVREAIHEAVLYERESCIDIVSMHGGSVEIEAAIRARSEK